MVAAPISWWVSILSGISFTYVPLTGYVSHSWEFIIAPSCSGVRFMLIAIATLLFSYVHRMGTRRAGFLWTLFSIVGSWLYTIFINGIRIVLSIYLPHWFYAKGFFMGQLTPERLHTVIGTVVYFSSLILLYQIGGKLSGKLCKKWTQKSGDRADQAVSSSDTVRGFYDTCVSIFIPAAWYLLIVLGFPFLVRIYRNDWTGFGGYALLVLSVCLTVLLPVPPVLRAILKRRHSHILFKDHTEIL